MQHLVKPTWALAALAAVALAAPSAEAATRLAHVAVKGEVTETNPEMALTLAPVKPNTLRELTARIRKAASDGKIDGLLLTLGNPSMGMAQAEELREAIASFRKAGKKVYVYTEAADLKDYVVASAADQIAVMPSGSLDLHGMAMELMYMRGLLDKLGLEADVIKMGKFKGAMEPLTDRKPSEATLEAMNLMLDDMYNAAVGHIAAGRNMTAEQVKKLIDEGPFTAEEALARKLVDKVTYLENFKQELKQDAGGNLTVLENYGVTKKELDLNFDNPFALLKLFSELMNPKQAAKDNSPKIAVVYAEGPITSGESAQSLMGGSSLGSDTFNKAIKAAREDASVKAVIVRIDSPGGSALASEAMWREIQATAKVKPVIASMGNVAASGGYYIASAASVIVAEPTTITGSIGVIGGKIVMKGAYEKLDIGVTRLQRGANAGIYSSSEKWTDGERAVIERHMKTIYDVFLDRVAAGRNKDRDSIHKLAQGRVWSGAAAKERGLVDELGGLEKAVSLAADTAGIRDYKIEVLPKPKNLFDVLFEGMGPNARTKVAAAAAGSGELRTLRAVLPGASKPVERLIDILHLMEREKVLMVMPFAVEVK
jgi:protease-4